MRENRDVFVGEEEEKKKRRHSPEQNVVKKRKGDKDLNRKWFNAIFSGSLEKTIRFIENGVDVNSVVGLHNRTALHAASLLGYVDIVKVLIRSGAGVNAVDKDGQTPLHLSITKGHVHVVQVLSVNGADMNAVDAYYLSALNYAVSNANVPCALQLLCCGAKVDEGAIKSDKTNLLRSIKERLEKLRSGNIMGASLMSNEEAQYLRCLAFALAVKFPGHAQRTFLIFRSFITYNSIFMVHGFHLGARSIWKHHVRGFLRRLD